MNLFSLDLYLHLAGKIPDVQHPYIVALAANLDLLALADATSDSYLGRTKSSIILKLANFCSLDEVARKKGQKGFTNIGKRDQEVWDEFSRTPELLKKKVQSILERVTNVKTSFEPIQANIHLLRLLGDQLVGSFQLAVFELVKNSYDADAKGVTITLMLEAKKPAIIIGDDGYGMDMDALRNGWLQLGSPLKRGCVRKPSKNFKRTPLGEKGIGRLAAFKLGNCLELTTRPEGSPVEYSLLKVLCPQRFPGIGSTLSGAS